MDKIDIVILAGDRRASLLIDDDNKAFVSVNNKPSIVHTLKSFLSAEHTGNIVIAGPKTRLEKTLTEHNLFPDRRIKIIEQKESLIENGEAGYIEALKFNDSDQNHENTDSVSDKHINLNYLDREKYKEKAILISSCDIPVITSHEIDEFILNADLSKYDYIIGLCGEESLKYYYPNNTFPGMILNYFHLKEGNYRVNNMNIVKPLKIERLDYIEKMYEVRYQKKFFNMIKLLISIMFSGRGVLRAFFKALKLHLALYCYDRGYEKFYPRFKESVSIEKIFRSIGKILGTRASYIITSYGGAALDIDHPEDRDVIEEMYESWVSHQKELHNIISKNHI